MILDFSRSNNIFSLLLLYSDSTSGFSLVVVKMLQLQNIDKWRHTQYTRRSFFHIVLTASQMVRNSCQNTCHNPWWLQLLILDPSSWGVSLSAPCTNQKSVLSVMTTSPPIRSEYWELTCWWRPSPATGSGWAACPWGWGRSASAGAWSTYINVST